VSSAVSAVESAHLQPAAAGARAVILFGHGSWWIGARGRAALSEVISRVASGGQPIEVDGHADRVGERRVNQRISEERARAVAAFLTACGIDPVRIRVRGYGEDRPSSDGRDRRVEVRIGGAR
jgi:OOP family OmpA-OmpF porin